MLKVNNLSVGYDSQIVIENLSFNIKKGSINTIIGPNGCGKSTLFKTISRSKKSISGEILIEGKNINKIALKDLSKMISVLPQSPKAPEDYTARDLVNYGRQPYLNWLGRFSKKDHEIVDWAIGETKLQNLEHRYVSTLSGGERQRTWISMALAQQTEFIMLDEPTTYLDISHQFELLELVKKLNQTMGITILMILHDLNQAARYSDYILAIAEGKKYIEGSPEEVITEKVLKDVFNMKVKIEHDKVNNCPYIIPISSIVEDFK